MRLDKYLKVSRIVKRRTVANQLCDAGKVVVNGKVTRASYDVKVSDVIEVRIGSNVMKVQVTKIQETVKKEDAKDMYNILWYTFDTKLTLRVKSFFIIYSKLSISNIVKIKKLTISKNFFLYIFSNLSFNTTLKKQKYYTY